MHYRKLGNSGLKISEIALGAWLTYGDAVEEDLTRDCIAAALEHGVNFIDLADIYAYGEAERLVGKIIKDLGVRRQDLVISSKAWWRMSDAINDAGLSRKHIMESVHNSLRRLGTDYLDLFFCHRYDPETPIEEVVRAIDDLIHQGKVLYWGTSMWSAAQIEEAVGAAQALRAYTPRTEQARYNMLDRAIEAEVLPVAAKHGIGVIAYSPLAFGVLSGKYNDGIPGDSRAARVTWLDMDLTEETLNKVRALAPIAADLGLTSAQLALAWVLRRPEISAVITGASKVSHIVSNVKATGVVLPPDVLETIEAILSGD
ncbi:MAG: aldo/keto reductase family protein [Anaerolineae bacterium]|nr:aldo/keto reductase family protein [Anaerolineae bacterium]